VSANVVAGKATAAETFEVTGGAAGGATNALRKSRRKKHYRGER